MTRSCSCCSTLAPTSTRKAEDTGNALQATSEGSCDKVVELLLSAGASANAQGRGSGNALDAASEEGHRKLFDLTLSLPPCTSFSTSFCFYALDLPSTAGNEILCVNEDSTDTPCSQLKSYFFDEAVGICASTIFKTDLGTHQRTS
jgi:hypothetical protein